MTHEPTNRDTTELMKQACPTAADAPFFNHCMHLARGMGMNWEEGLHYVIEQRKALLPAPSAPVRRTNPAGR